MDAWIPGADQRLRRARMVTLVTLAASAGGSLFLPGIGLVREPDLGWVGLGAVGVGTFAAAQWGALYAAVTPWLAEATRRRLLVGFAIASAVSVPLVGPVASGHWATWAWLAACVVGTVPLLVGRWAAGVIAVAAVVLAWWIDGSLRDAIVITGGFGLGVAAVNGLQVWFWDLLLQAQQGRDAQSRLAVAEERLRFARDVHDLLGHNLTVIALKAELAARLAPVDAERSGREATEIQRLAASALTEMREVVQGYRAVDLRGQLDAVQQVLRSSGMRCTVTQPAEDLPPTVTTQLAAVLREASTNVLRHSKAGWCRIEITRHGTDVRMAVTNDGAGGPGPDHSSSGLRGLADRLAETGGAVLTRTEAGVFTLEATVRAAT